MPYEGTLFEFLSEVGLQQYHLDFVNKLGVTAIDHLAYVQTDDVLHVGMTAPEWRRLKASMKKVKKGKFNPGKNTKVSKSKPTIVRVPSQPGTPTGGHIIPASAINILDRELGQGEFGKVMQGVWTDKDGQKIQVAVKCLSPERLSSDKSQDFVKEAAIMYSLNHDHLVKLFGVVLDVDTSLMLVTEFAPLRSLLENIKQPALHASFPVTLLLEFAGQMAGAMKYLHVSNIIHRDLATRNILLFVEDDGTKKVKISDFGLSRRLILGENYRSEMKPNLKLPLAWMPVEALTKLTFTKASDVWSFGVTMWEMFTYGRQPWATHCGEEILEAIDKPSLQRLERPEACPTKVYEILLKCWKHEPEKRPSFAEICEELPKVKPLQVRAITHYKMLKSGELTYRADDIITVLDTNELTGIWTGILGSGKVGTFLRCNTTLMGSSSNTGGSRLRRWKSGFRSDKRDARKSRLTADAIGTPMGARHIFHVGPDGTVQGDATFGGDYRSLPPEGAKPHQMWSSSSSVSSASSASTSRSPPHSPYRPGLPPSDSPGKPPRASVVQPSQSVPSLPPAPAAANATAASSSLTKVDMTSSNPELVAPRPSSESSSFGRPSPPMGSNSSHEVEKTRHQLEEDEMMLSRVEETETDRDAVEDAEIPDVYYKKDKLPSPDSMSLSLNLEMGSLLDEFMCEWDDRRTTVVEAASSGASKKTPTGEDPYPAWEPGVNHATTNGGATSGNTTRPGSLHLTEGGKSRGGPTAGAVSRSSSRKKGASQDDAAAADDSPSDLTPLHNMIIKDSPSNPAKTYRRVSAAVVSEPSLIGASPTVGVAEDDSCGGGGAGEEAPTRLRDKHDEINFVRLSTSPPHRAENDYVDTSSLIRSISQRQQPSPAAGTRQPFVTSMSSSSSSSERTSSPVPVPHRKVSPPGDSPGANEYEELSQASSPSDRPPSPPSAVGVTSSVLQVNDEEAAAKEVGRSQSMRVPLSGPATEHLLSKRKGQFGRSRSLKETAATARAAEDAVYSKLIGGRISGSSSPQASPLSQPPPRSSSPSPVKISARKSRNVFSESNSSSSSSPPGGIVFFSGQTRAVLERVNSCESSDGSLKGESRGNNGSDRDSQEIQFADPLGDSGGSLGVKALRNRFDASSSSPKKILTNKKSQSPIKSTPPKVPPRASRPQRSTPINVVQSKTNVALHIPSGLDQSPGGANNNDNDTGEEDAISSVGRHGGSTPDGHSSDVQLSPRTLQSLGRNMPRRVRRPIGEGRIKRRGSSGDASGDSDSDTRQDYLLSPRDLGGDSSSADDDAVSNHSQREPVNSGTPGRGVGGFYPASALHSLPDLLEDQTNRKPAKHSHPPPPPDPQHHHHHHHRDAPPTAGSPHLVFSDRSPPANANEVERVDLADFSPPLHTPPRTTSCKRTDKDAPTSVQARSQRHPMIRSRTVDSPTVPTVAAPAIPKRHSINPFHRHQAKPPLLASHSLDLGRSNSAFVEDVFLRASPEDIRSLVRQENTAGLSDETNDEVDLSDLPSRPPPPIPTETQEPDKPTTTYTSKMQLNLDVKIPSPFSPIPVEQTTGVAKAQTLDAGKTELIRETEYVIMKPQRNAVELNNVPGLGDFGADGISLMERQLPPVPQLQNAEFGRFSRSSSVAGNASPFADLSTGISPPNPPSRERRGTIASACPSSQVTYQNREMRSLERLNHKSKSFEVLPEDDLSGLKAAESLTDVLARTYRSPPAPVSNYMSPRQLRNPVNHEPQRLWNHSSSPGDKPSSPAPTCPPLPPRPSDDYIDMTKRSTGHVTLGVNRSMMSSDGGQLRSSELQNVRKELPVEISPEECTQVLKDNLWNVALSVKILKIRYLTHSLLLDDTACRVALKESNWDLGMAAAILGSATESTISL